MGDDDDDNGDSSNEAWDELVDDDSDEDAMVVLVCPVISLFISVAVVMVVLVWKDGSGDDNAVGGSRPDREALASSTACSTCPGWPVVVALLRARFAEEAKNGRVTFFCEVVIMELFVCLFVCCCNRRLQLCCFLWFWWRVVVGSGCFE